MRRARTETYPSGKIVVDAPVQMEREIAALRQATGNTSGRDLEAMLGEVALAVPQARPPSNIDYANGELRLRGMGLNADEGRMLLLTLKAHGYNANNNADTLVVTQ